MTQAESQIRVGSCHCGAVHYEARVSLDQVIECNCSHCYRKGMQLVFVPPEDFELKSGEGGLSEYTFNRHRIQHRFCKTCGVESFAHGTGPDGKPMMAINVRCLEDVEPWSVTTTHFDGLHKS